MGRTNLICVDVTKKELEMIVSGLHALIGTKKQKEIFVDLLTNIGKPKDDQARKELKNITEKIKRKTQADLDLELLTNRLEKEVLENTEVFK